LIKVSLKGTYGGCGINMMNDNLRICRLWYKYDEW